jgi:pimeloyl-ACP methyl ester carboxylesterase
MSVAQAPTRWWGRHPAELRWQLEAARLLADPVFYGAGVPHGDGRPVLLLPGFLAGDFSLATMAAWLRRIGYRPGVAGFITNSDCSERAMRRAETKLDALVDRHARRAAIIGHSRGGHFARALAARRPEAVSHAVSMGGGLNRQHAISVPTLAALAAVRSVHRLTTDRRERRGCLTETCGCDFVRDYVKDFPEEVRLTSIYSKGDGVVRWESCVVPYADNVEVSGSHVGLAFNRKVYRVLARALHEPERTR